MSAPQFRIPLLGAFWLVNAGTVVPRGSRRRRWLACREYGFISAGQTPLDVDYILKPQPNDIICAYENGTGFLAIGMILRSAVAIDGYFLEDGKSLHNLPFVSMGRDGHDSLFQNSNTLYGEHVAAVHWYPLNPAPLKISRGQAGHFAPRNTVAQITNQDTIEALQKHFGFVFV